MIDFKSGMMRVLSGKPEPIKEWVVAFQTIEGLFTTLDEAVASAEKCGYPVTMIQPVPVALDAQGHYEVCIR